MNASGQPTMWVTLPTSGEPGIDMPPPTVNLAVCSVNAWGAACDSPPYSFQYYSYYQGGTGVRSLGSGVGYPAPGSCPGWPGDKCPGPSTPCYRLSRRSSHRRNRKD
jgi:hypothetical protein